MPDSQAQSQALSQSPNGNSDSLDSDSIMTSTRSNRLDYKRTQKALNVVKKYLETLRVSSATMAESRAAIIELSSKAQAFFDLEYNTDSDDSNSEVSSSSDGNELCEILDKKDKEELESLMPISQDKAFSNGTNRGASLAAAEKRVFANSLKDIYRQSFMRRCLPRPADMSSDLAGICRESFLRRQDAEKAHLLDTGRPHPVAAPRALREVRA